MNQCISSDSSSLPCQTTASGFGSLHPLTWSNEPVNQQQQLRLRWWQMHLWSSAIIAILAFKMA